jgi:hypothetical protein
MLTAERPSNTKIFLSEHYTERVLEHQRESGTLTSAAVLDHLQRSTTRRTSVRRCATLGALPWACSSSTGAPSRAPCDEAIAAQPGLAVHANQGQGFRNRRLRSSATACDGGRSRGGGIELSQAANFDRRSLHAQTFAMDA